MINEVLDILTEYLTNERLDKIVEQMTEYQELDKEIDQLFNELENLIPSQKGKKAFRKYDAAVHSRSALYSKYSYQQGMKDITQFI